MSALKDTHNITGLVLAGGRSLRMGGVNKGLQQFEGIPLALHAARRLQLQLSGGVALNANSHLEEYRAWGLPVWPDVGKHEISQERHGPHSQHDHPSHREPPAYAGPLAGMLTGLLNCATPWLVTVPCDTPFFPSDLVEQLACSVNAAGTLVAVAATRKPSGISSAELQLQPVFCLLHTSVLPGLARHLASGQHQVRAWLATESHTVAVFDAPDSFANANTLAQLEALQARNALRDLQASLRG